MTIVTNTNSHDIYSEKDNSNQKQIFYVTRKNSTIRLEPVFSSLDEAVSYAKKIEAQDELAIDEANKISADKNNVELSNGDNNSGSSLKDKGNDIYSEKKPTVTPDEPKKITHDEESSKLSSRKKYGL
ncbi:hypothetical protein H2241_18525 [Pantoea ananatis]|uniref:hypothetical protein n=1 Tax=Pantoea ananas TaxID=553 RepID=UPI00158AF752|nr:hypothetical protein [Pantoea ananatis]MBA4822944.1 hypothetical protein [Pantoea ananatis]QKV87482.1 hypothetical protein FOB88_10280 [Pantoea ananatis]